MHSQQAMARILGVRRGQQVVVHACSQEVDNLDDRHALWLTDELQFDPVNNRWTWALEFPTPVKDSLLSAGVTLRLRQD